VVLVAFEAEDGGCGKRPKDAVCEVAVALCCYIISI
jgi:hypothetical protein